MKIIKPVQITDANLVSSSVLEDDYTAYNPSTTYSIGAKVIVVATHKVYESLQNSNTGHYPPDSLSGDAPWWLEVSYTNKWLAFDSKLGSQATSTAGVDIQYVLTPGLVEGISLFNLKGESVTITMTDSADGVVYNYTTPLIQSEAVIDWYTYFFADYSYKYNLTLLDLPLFGAASIQVDIAAESGQPAKVGEIVVGRVATLGFTQYNPTINIVDYSTKETDTFGNFSILERAYSKRIDVEIVVENSKINTVYRQLADLRATPVVWVTTENDLYESTYIVYGYYKDFSMVVPQPVWANMTLSIEGLT